MLEVAQMQDASAPGIGDRVNWTLHGTEQLMKEAVEWLLPCRGAPREVAEQLATHLELAQNMRARDVTAFACPSAAPYSELVMEFRDGKFLDFYFRA